MVSGEEKGLFGSQFYIENPIFDLENTMVNLNIDMVGRQDTVQDDNNYDEISTKEKKFLDQYVSDIIEIYDTL